MNKFFSVFCAAATLAALTSCGAPDNELTYDASNASASTPAVSAESGALIASTAFNVLNTSKRTVPKIGDPAPPLKVLQWIQGPEVAVTNGQVTVVEFWETWCPPCREVIPHLNELHLRYKDSGLKLVAISGEPQIKIAPFIAKQGSNMTFPVAIGSRDTYMAYPGAWGITAIPQAFVIDKNGKYFWQGDPRDPAFHTAIRTALEALNAAKK